MIARFGKRLGALAVALVTLLGPARHAAAAEDYRIGAEDVLSISVWMHPELERTATVGSDGDLVLPPIGAIKAAGSTPKQLADRIGDRLSAYLRQTTTVTVTVTQYLSHSVLVSGAVAHPGRFGFEVLPGLLDVLSQAGGALPNADLSRVQVMRREAGALRTLTADLTRALAEGSEAGLPKLEVGDVVVVSSALATAATSDAAAVLGEVQRPGLYPVGAGQDLWLVLAQAGGATGRGDLTSVKVLAKGMSPGAAESVNLIETLRHGNRTPRLVKPGDIVFLNSKGGGLGSGFALLLAVTRDVVNLVVLSQAIKKL